MNLPLILSFYAIVLLLIKALQVFYDRTNKPSFRDSEGDITTEVGYCEDSVGHPLPLNQDDQCQFSVAHIQSTGETNLRFR